MTRFTEDTWLPAIFVFCWFLLVVAILGVVTRLGTKWWIYHKFTKDDYVIIFAIVLDIAQGIAIATATGNGYGNHIATLNDAQKNAIMKSQYAASMLSVGSLAASKISFVMFVRSITAVSLDRKIGQGIIIFLTLWGIVSIITVAFQCQFPPTWNYLSGKCYDRQTWENFFSISNVITEIAIVIHTVMIIARIQTRLERKLKIAFVFGLRLMVVAAAIVQIVLLNRTFHDPDVTYATWSVSVANQFILCSSIITACSAQFKPFLDSLRSSGMRLDALTGSYAYKSQRSYEQRSYGQDSHSHRYRSHKSKTTSSKANSIPLRSISGRNEPRDNNTASNEVFVSASTPAADWDAASATSQSQIIRETRTVTVTEEFRRSSDAGVSL